MIQYHSQSLGHVPVCYNIKPGLDLGCEMSPTFVILNTKH